MPSKDKYTDPQLRDEVKQEVQAGDKGGQPGQWSARKAQFMASEYKKRGGGYTTDKNSGQDDSQKNLSKWTEEEWQTKEGSGNAKQDDGTEKRYLPKKAWEKMTDQEKEETDQKKRQDSKEGKQFVANTDKAQDARKEANEEETDNFESKKASPSGKRNTSNANSDDGNSRSSKNDQGASAKGKQSNGKKESRSAKKDQQSTDGGAGNDDDAEHPPTNGHGERKAKSDADEKNVAVAKDGQADRDDETAPDAAAQDAEDGDAEFVADENTADDEDDLEEDEEAAKEDDKVGAKEDRDMLDANEDDADANENKEQDNKQSSARGQKRGRPTKPTSQSNKKQKDNNGDGQNTDEKSSETVGSKHDSAEAPAPAGSKDRLPKAGQEVSWRALPGWVHGKVIEIVFETKTVRGKEAKGSKDDPRIVLEADSGKVCVHKPEGCHFE